MAGSVMCTAGTLGFEAMKHISALSKHDHWIFLGVHRFTAKLAVGPTGLYELGALPHKAEWRCCV